MASISGTILSAIQTTLNTKLSSSEWPTVTGLDHATKSSVNYSFFPQERREDLDDNAELVFYPLSGEIEWMQVPKGTQSKKYLEGEYPVVLRFMYGIDDVQLNDQTIMDELIGLCEYFRHKSIVSSESETTNDIDWSYEWVRHEPVKTDEGNLIPPYQVSKARRSNLFMHYTQVVFKVYQTY